MKNEVKESSWLEKFSRLLLGDNQPEAKVQDLLQTLEKNKTLQSDTVDMIEGVLLIAEAKAGDIMIPRSQVIFVERDNTFSELINIVSRCGHSRFPVIGDNRDDIEGILLAKDLLNFARNANEDDFNIRDLLRKTLIIPESRRLNMLLKDFKQNHSHMAMVVDEYGSVAGLVTLEDVLEEIVGEIADETDIDETEPNIQPHDRDSSYRIKAITPLTEFNEFFNSKLSDESCDTIGGFILKHLGHMPSRNELINIEAFEFTVLSADRRRIRTLKVTKSHAVSLDTHKASTENSESS